jgi:putative transposase
VSAVADAVGVSRPHLSAMQRPKERCRRGRPPLPDANLVADIRRLIVDLPTYGYRRVHALLRSFRARGARSHSWFCVPCRLLRKK